MNLLGFPGIIEGAAQGKGRSRQVVAVARFVNFNLVNLLESRNEQDKKECRFLGWGQFLLSFCRSARAYT